MSRIFVAGAVSTVLFAGAAAISIAHDNSGSDSEQMDAIAQLFASGFEMSVIVPIILLVGLLLATLGVFSQL